MGPVETIRNLGDVAGMRTDYNADDFEAVFYANFDDTDTSVYSVICLVWIISRYLGDWNREAVVRQNLTKLY
jgi:hypothetical protein